MLRAAAGHLQSDWTMIAVGDAALPGLGTRFLATGPHGQVIDSVPGMPGWLREELASARTGSTPAGAGPGQLDDAVPGGAPARLIRVPLVLDGAVLGRLVASYGWALPIEDADLWVLHILANQAAVSMHTATLHVTSRDLRREAQQLYDEIARSSDDLRARTAELARAEVHLQLLHDRELLDAERHRIALDLHDSVAQYVLSAGLAVDVCRAEAADRGDASAAGRLLHARDLIAKAQDQVRSAVFALHHQGTDDEVAVLPELLQGLAAQHRPGRARPVRRADPGSSRFGRPRAHHRAGGQPGGGGPAQRRPGLRGQGGGHLRAPAGDPGGAPGRERVRPAQLLGHGPRAHRHRRP
jgi:Histidine kinase